MPTYGGLSPQPERYGGKGSGPRLQRILESLDQARGTAYDVSSTSIVHAENIGLARAVDGAWGVNVRLGNAFDPYRLTGPILKRWEAIMGIFPTPTATEVSRRAAVVAQWKRFGVVFNTSRLVTVLTSLLGTTLVAIQFTSVGSATTYWPGGTPNADTPWYSTVCHMLFKVSQPTGMTDGEFYSTVNSINAFLDGEAPAHICWDWWRVDSVNGVQGFWLDSAANLDNDIFDV